MEAQQIRLSLVRVGPHPKRLVLEPPAQVIGQRDLAGERVTALIENGERLPQRDLGFLAGPEIALPLLLAGARTADVEDVGPGAAPLADMSLHGGPPPDVTA